MRIVDDCKLLQADEWKAIGVKLYGKSAKDWKFVCPNCGNIQSAQDFIALKEAGIIPETFDIAKYFHFSCIGRYDTRIKKVGTMSDPTSPCDYTNGGLFCIAKVRVEIFNPDDCASVFVWVFDFADDYSELVTLEG